jgi:hypothetical protein
MIFGIFRKIKRFIVIFFVVSLLIIVYILSNIFNDSFKIDTRIYN